MTLVDSSLWIEVFRRRNPLDLEAVVDLEAEVTCLPVVQFVAASAVRHDLEILHRDRMATATEVACMLRLTKSRIAELRLMYEEPEPPPRPPTR